MRKLTRSERACSVLLTLVLVASACTGGASTAGSSGDPDSTTSTTTGTVQLPDVALAAALRPFDACEDFLGYVKAEATERVGPYGLDGGGGFIGFGVAEDSARQSSPTSAAAGGDEDSASVASDSATFSGTNVQEIGVDEPDTVKTDGNRILAVANQKLHYVDVSGGSPQLIGSLPLPTETYDHRLLVSGNRVLVLAMQFSDVPRPQVDERLATDLTRPVGEMFTLIEVDVTNPTAMTIVSTLGVEGVLVSGRQIGDTARIVVTSRPNGLGFVYPANGDVASEERATEVNRAVIADSTLEQWLPSYTLSGPATDVQGGTLLPCEQVNQPPEFSGFGLLSVLTFDMTTPLGSGEGVGVLADGQTVYASTENLYVGTNAWVDPAVLSGIRAPDIAPEDYTTAIHKFSIAAAGPAAYQASGKVAGYLLNQFAMSEHEGNLRVATTQGAPWAAPAEGQSESFVTVLSQQEDRLAQVGQLGGLGRGEQIYSVRFVGDVGYVVTFRQTDPLYTIDLADPAHPVVAGELKILGYSAYLHPLADGRIMGVGQSATEEGQTQGTQVSVFDVSNPASPQLVHQLAVIDANSEAEYNHLAFLHWAPTGLTVMPLTVYSYDQATGADNTFSGAIGIGLDASGLTERARISHPGPDPYSGAIQRSLVVGDHLYTLSQVGLLSSDLTTLADQTFLPLGFGG